MKRDRNDVARVVAGPDLRLKRLRTVPQVVSQMAEDDRDRTREKEAEREAEIESEMERVDQDPDQVREGSEDLGTQSAESGTPRNEEEAEEERPVEPPDEQRSEQGEGAGGDEEAPEADDEE